MSMKQTIVFLIYIYTSKGGSRRAEKSRKVLIMMKAAKLGWAGAGAGKEQGWSRSRAGAGPGRAEAGQGRSRAEVGTGQEEGRSR